MAVEDPALPMLVRLAEEQPDWVKLLARFAPDQAGALWIGILLTVVIAFDFRKFFSFRNLGVVLLVLPAFPLLDIMNWSINAEPPKNDPASAHWLALSFRILFPLTGLIALVGLILAFQKPKAPWSFNLGRPALGALLFLVLVLDVVVALSRAGEDAGPYTSLGTRRWLDTGVMPYFDPMLRGTNTVTNADARPTPGHGAAATYGPLLYAAHIPFHLLLAVPSHDAAADPNDRATYQPPPDLATRLCALMFHLILMLALGVAGRRFAGADAGFALPALYGGSSFVLGIGSDPYLICGLPFISHVAPTAFVVLALATLARPLMCGLCLAVGAGLLFFPAFFFPLFLGYFFFRKAGAFRFTIGFALGGVLIAALVLYFSQSLDGKNPVSLFLEATLEHQEGGGPSAYGKSHFSFWHPYTGEKEWWQTSLVSGSSALKPTFVGFIALGLLAFFLARGRSPAQMAGLVVMLAAAIQLWKTHAGGTYVEWYLPALLLALSAGPAAGVMAKARVGAGPVAAG